MPAPYNPPKKNEEFLIRIALEDVLNPGNFKASPTIEFGDFKVDLDGAGLNDLTTTPYTNPAGSVLVYLHLTAAEMDADVVTVVGIDQGTIADREWSDFVISIPTTA